MCEVFYQIVIFVNGMPCNMNVNIMSKGRLKNLSHDPTMYVVTNLAAFVCDFRGKWWKWGGRFHNLK